jgi:hypothetical protein
MIFQSGYLTGKLMMFGLIKLTREYYWMRPLIG